MTRVELEIAYAWADILTPHERHALLAYLAQAMMSGRLQATAMVKLRWDGDESYTLLLPDADTGAYVPVEPNHAPR